MAYMNVRQAAGMLETALDLSKSGPSRECSDAWNNLGDACAFREAESVFNPIACLIRATWSTHFTGSPDHTLADLCWDIGCLFDCDRP